jgi:menaquinol-cytochrome c reductase iron-sulfur subunit
VTDQEGDRARPARAADVTRRRFLARLSIGVGSLAAAALALPGVGFVLAPLVRKVPEIWRTVGRKDEFAVGHTVSVTFRDPSPLPWAGVTAQTAAWLRRESDDRFVAFSVNCTHLGCPVRWLAQAELFMCPCHGGVYYQDGRVAAGPPPHPLIRYEVRVRNGEVQVRTGALPIV